MRTPLKLLLRLGAAAAAVAVTLTPATASAQFDVDPPLPNVLLLVDNSGSMEYLVEPSASGKNQLPGSVPGSECEEGKTPTLLNRWATLASVLTGQIKNFSCKAVPRNGDFTAEYTFLGAPPYDRDYFLPFHRLLSSKCTPGPGVAPTNYWDWPNGAIQYHDIGSPTTACSGEGWAQAPDGILDTFRDRVRFGMMTFDTFADAGVGAVGNAPDGARGMKGLWSYYKDWTTSNANTASGNLPSCAPTVFEVGARNQAAPPWEGRLIPFGPGDAQLTDIQTTNDHIQEALIALRPYGATPIDGMFDDAREFLLNDKSNDPSTSKPFGPSADPFVQGGCRKTSIILLSDGEPNMALRPECEATGGSPPGQCPYPRANEIAEELASLPGSGQILTYVVGFGVSNPGALSSLGLSSCAELDPKQCDDPKTPLPAELRPCCSLNEIAAAGGTSHAFFADDQLSLKAMISAILAGISAGSTARAVPVFSGAASSDGATAKALQGNAPASGYRFLSRFKAEPTGRLWSGQIDRERYVCESGKASLKQPDAAVGDDFAANINASTTSPARSFFSFAAPPVGTGQIFSDRTIRPRITADDGLGIYAKDAPDMPRRAGDSFAKALSFTPQLLGMSPASPPLPCTTTLKAASSSACAELLLRWEVGELNVTLPNDTRDAAACPIAGGCSELGAIYHSTPAVVGPPVDTLRDDSYVEFALQQAKRPIMLYTASTDGQLHAFKVASGAVGDTAKVDKLANNELWSFLPPVVLPSLLSSYNQQALLTDGAPVTADVVFERRRSQKAAWSTVLVAGGGTAGGFYYALDITKPDEPRFLWQISTDQNGSRLFGRTTPRPAIATVSIPDGSGPDIKEVAVAILSGGTSSFINGACPRDNTGSLIRNPQRQPRPNVHCWAQFGGARSLTIVRLDTGEVLMNFRDITAKGPFGPGNSNSKIVQFSSPISGIPAPFPSQIGQVADRIYVGDADGALWRIDLSGGKPQEWKAELAWDAYSLGGEGVDVGQPVQTAPVIGTNALGDTVIMFTTGDQDLLTPSAAMDTRLWSLKEKRSATAATFDVTDAFFKQFTGGARVTGPMALFASVLYFSTFAPASTGSVCAFGGSAVWALDYQTAAARFPVDKNQSAFKEFEEEPNTITFGVALTQTPTCADTECSTDPFFGQSCFVNNSVDGGGYEIVWNKGLGQGVTGNTAVKTTPDGIQSLSLQTPHQSTRIDSWAGILE